MEEQVRAFLASLESQPTYSSSTRMAYDNDLRCFLSFLNSTLNRSPLLADFNTEQVACFLEAERKSGRRPSTLLRRRASLRRFAAFLNTECPEWIVAFDAKAPLLGQAPLEAATNDQARYLSDDQINQLWAILEASPRPRARRDQAILALLLECGLTVGTLIRLNLQDVDTRLGRLRITTENGQEIWVPLGNALLPLQRYILEGRPELNYHTDEPAYFISQTGGRMSRQGVWQVLRQWGARAGIPVTLSPRLARHTAAHHLGSAGRPIHEIQALLGHSNPLSTQALLRRLGAELEEGTA